MKAITLKCKTAGFSYGDEVEIGTGEEKISSEDAQALVDNGLAVELKVKEISAKKGREAFTKLEGQVKSLTEEKDGLEGEVETLIEEKDILEKQLAEAINLPKGTEPEGYVKAN